MDSTKNEWNPGIKQFFTCANYFERKELYKFISSYAKTITGVVLDVGCGSMPYEELFVNAIYIGLDLEGVTKSKSNKIIYSGLGEELPIRDESVDAIVSFQALYQIKDVERYIELLCKKLSQDGIFLISLPFIWFDSGSNWESRYSTKKFSEILHDNFIQTINIQKLNLGISGLLILFSGIIYKYYVQRLRNRYLYIIFKTVTALFFNIIILIAKSVSFKMTDFYIDFIIYGKKSISANHVNEKIL